MAASTVTTLIGVFAGLLFLSIAVLVVWAWRLQGRQYPTKPLVTESEEVKRELRWYGFIYGGGHG